MRKWGASIPPRLSPRREILAPAVIIAVLFVMSARVTSETQQGYQS